MGRQLRRVPLDFAHPVGETWPGFLNPHYAKSSKCDVCDGSGYSPHAQLFHDQWYGKVTFSPRWTGSTPFSPDHPAIVALATRNSRPDLDLRWPGCDLEPEKRRLARHFNAGWNHHLSSADVDALVDADRLPEFTRRPRTKEQADELAKADGYWMKEPNGYRPTAAEVNEWSLSGMGHDCINQHVVIRARCGREGVELHCYACEGEGDVWESEEAKAACEAWEPTEPPTGEGWQMWETVSEGSPISPVFASAGALATWLSVNKARDGNYEQWLKMIEGDGWAPSMMMSPETGVVSGVEAIGGA